MDKIKIDDNYTFVNVKGEWELYLNEEIHPSFPSEIYKYYSCNEKNLASLYEGYFWFAKPAKFNDPFDCNLNLLNWSKKSNHVDKWI